MSQVQVPGTEHFVNPDFVTNVFPEKIEWSSGPTFTTIEVIGNAGYGTRRIHSTEKIEVVVAALNGARGKVRLK